MGKFAVIGVVIGIVLALGASAVFYALWTQNVARSTPFITQMQDWHDSMHAGGGMSGGMMGRGMPGGMMRRGGPPINSTPQPDESGPVNQTITITARNLRFEPTKVEVRAGQTVRFVIVNRDAVMHNIVSAQANIPLRLLPGGATESIVWTAPTAKGTYRALCTYHPGMTLDIEVR